MTPAITDAAVAALWLALALHNLWQAGRTRTARDALGPVVLRAWRPSVLLVPAVLVVVPASAFVLERTAGRFAVRPWLAVAGLGLAGCGVVLHVWARRALGPLWSGVVQVRERHEVVERGPYAYVRHPIYLALLLLAGGTFLAHPSLATACLASGLGVGLVVKLRLEERALRAALGAEYERYAARVPALVPGVQAIWSRRRRCAAPTTR